MKSFTKIAVLAIISLTFVAETNAQTDSTIINMRDSLNKEIAIMELQLKFQGKVDSLYHELAMNNDLNKKERIALQNELNDLKNAGMPTAINVANGNAHVVKANETAETIKSVEEGKRATVDARTYHYAAQEYDHGSYYENKTEMRDALGDLKSGIVPTAEEAKEQPGYEMAVYKAGRLSNSQMRTELKKEKAERKKLRKYGPQPEEKPAEVEYESQAKAEQKSVSTEADQNVQTNKPGSNLSGLYAGKVQASTVQCSTPTFFHNGVEYINYKGELCYVKTHNGQKFALWADGTLIPL